MATIRRHAGGRATQAGMDFGAAVGVWLASHLVTATPVGKRFGLSVGAVPIRLQFETGAALDDIEVQLSDSSTLLIQCKVHPALSKSAGSDLASTISQLVRFVVSCSTSGTPANSANVSAVLAVAADASGSLDILNAVCRLFGSGATWREIYALANQRQRDALDVFRTHSDAEWIKQLGSPTPENELARLASLFRIVRFDPAEDGSDHREAARNLGARLFGSEEAGSAPLDALNAIVRRLVRSGAPADRSGVLDLLRAAGHQDLLAPGYDNDIARLQQRTRSELTRLQRHSRLPIDGGLAIMRACMPALKAAAQEGSLLVVGEPGAGKTGVLVALAEQQLLDAAPTVFFSVDDLYGVSTLDALRTALDLEKPVLDVLHNWPGGQPGLLVIDALDASRGGPSETLFARFIEDALRVLGERWSIVASIRTFDLRNGRRFREIMAGMFPSAAYAEPDLHNVRHFKIPRLVDEELAGLTRRSQRLGELLTHPPESLRDLLRNVFNLSIACELISGGTTAASICTIATQSNLLEEYEDQRLSSIRQQAAIAASVSVMIERRRLTVRKVDIGHEALEDVLRTGILVSSGDRVQFAHHVLFDHAAGRFYLDWNDATRLRTQVTEDPAIGLLLGPSLKFALERVWRDDSPGRPATWASIIAITSAQGTDPVVASVALRTVAERVDSTIDVQGLRDLIRDTSRAELVGPALSKLSRFVSISLADRAATPSSMLLAWAEVASEAAMVGHRLYVDAVRFLLLTISERGDFSDRQLALKFGEAARRLLMLAWQFEPELTNVASSAIRMVTKSFDTDVAASRAILARILEEPRFTQHAHEEAPWLAEGVSTIFGFDSDFAIKIYGALFGRAAPAEGDSLMGASRIMPLISNKRQDYDHARWQLQKALPKFLSTRPDCGTIALNRAVLGLTSSRRPHVRSLELGQAQTSADQPLTVLEDGLSLQQWRSDAEHRGALPGNALLSVYVQFLLACSSADFELSVRALLTEASAASIWARIFGIAVERPGVAEDLLWPIVTSRAVLGSLDAVKDATDFIAAVFPRRSDAERYDFCNKLLVGAGSDDEQERRFWQNRAARFLSVVADELIAESALLEFRAQLVEEGLLNGNRPYMTVESGWGGRDDITDSLLKDEGANLDSGPDAELRQVVRELDLMTRASNGVVGPEALSELWALTVSVVSKIDKLVEPAPHERVVHSSWGSVSNAIEKIVQSEHYNSSFQGHPSIAALTAILDRMAASPYPEERGPSHSGLMSWGNWDVRVYVAASYMRLATLSTASAQSMHHRLMQMLDDPAPTVRLQVVQSLNTLWQVDRDQMWKLAARVTTEETDAGVIGFFIGGPLIRLADSAPERCEEFLRVLLDKLPRQEEESSLRGDFHEAFANIAARMWILGRREAAKGWILSWVGSLADSDAYLWPLISWLREALFASFHEGAGDREREIQVRAREIVHAVVTAATAAMVAAKPVLLDFSTIESDRENAERQYKAGLRLIEHCCSQLYFGSGAFKGGNADSSNSGLRNDEQTRSFLSEYESILDCIASSGNAAISYRLVELYEYLAGAAPERVFDKVAELVVGPAASDGYHYESLALDTVARLVRRYLADFRVVFDDPGRRARLVSVLELFSNAGWPEALKLLYELPDFLR